MSIAFPLLNKRTSLGIIPDCLIPVEVLTRFGYQALEFVLDTGADFTMLPRHMADVIGIDLAACPHDRSRGIEGHDFRVYPSRISIRIGGTEIDVRCLFSDKETTPYILGRADVFSAFNILFDNRNRTVKFLRIRRVPRRKSRRKEAARTRKRSGVE
ncbi:MAG: retroviral-like aspartic protease family protein [Kiritimatiellae bacterium]|nr:retroviral-like aspartic protease family protein [Kiritimatiellia bacterium]